MSRLTRAGARDLTEAIDRVASAVQENPELLGIDPRIAKDFAYRCDLISDAVETKAASNFPKSAEAEFDAEDIGEVSPGPLESVGPEGDISGHFTQKEFEQLSEVVEKLGSFLNKNAPPKTAAVAPAAPGKQTVKGHGFNLTK